MSPVSFVVLAIRLALFSLQHTHTHTHLGKCPCTGMQVCKYRNIQTMSLTLSLVMKYNLFLAHGTVGKTVPIAFSKRTFPFLQHLCQWMFPFSDYCASSPCKNSGVCKDVGSTHRCICQRGTTGTNCESKSLFSPSVVPLVVAPQGSKKKSWVVVDRIKKRVSLHLT